MVYPGVKPQEVAGDADSGTSQAIYIQAGRVCDPGRRDCGFGHRDCSSRRHHAVGGVDVVFEDNRDAVQRATGTLGLALSVEGVGDAEHIGVEFDQGIDRRATLVDLSRAVSSPVAILD